MHDPVGNVLLLFLSKDFLLSACFSHVSFPIADFQLPILLPCSPQTTNWQSAIGHRQCHLLLSWRLLLGDGCTSWTFASASVCVSSLAAHRQRATMSQTTIATDIHQPLDIHLDALAKIAFDLTLRFQNGAYTAQLVLTQISDASIDIDARFLEHRTRARAANAVDIRQSNFGSFIWR